MFDMPAMFGALLAEDATQDAKVAVEADLVSVANDTDEAVGASATNRTDEVKTIVVNEAIVAEFVDTTVTNKVDKAVEASVVDKAIVSETICG
jgi:hypothetical protein